MGRFFNTTGPCDPDRHYMLPPEKRLVGAQLDRYIGNQLYWVLHAPRQTGKTTFLQNWMREINAGGQARACYVSVEVCQQVPSAEDAIPAICHAIREYAATWMESHEVPPLPRIEPTNALSRILTDWAALVAPKPLVVLFDEVDVLQDQAMVGFPVSVALVGMRDLRDYLIRSKDGEAVNPGSLGSLVNIKHDSANIPPQSGSGSHMTPSTPSTTKRRGSRGSPMRFFSSVFGHSVQTASRWRSTTFGRPARCSSGNEPCTWTASWSA